MGLCFRVLRFVRRCVSKSPGFLLAFFGSWRIAAIQGTEHRRGVFSLVKSRRLRHFDLASDNLSSFWDSEALPRARQPSSFLDYCGCGLVRDKKSTFGDQAFFDGSQDRKYQECEDRCIGC